MTDPIARAVADPDRLATLRGLALLDTPAEESFDRFHRDHPAAGTERGDQAAGAAMAEHQVGGLKRLLHRVERQAVVAFDAGRPRATLTDLREHGLGQQAVAVQRGDARHQPVERHHGADGDEAPAAVWRAGRCRAAGTDRTGWRPARLRGVPPTG